MKLGGTVATVGFPNIGLQGFAPKLAKGEIASLSGLRRAGVFHLRSSRITGTGDQLPSCRAALRPRRPGAGDDARYFQISVPVQPGNSGGALVDERGNVVGVVSAKLSARGAGGERRVARERELRGEEQLSPELPGIGAGSVGEVERAGDEGAEV